MSNDSLSASEFAEDKHLRIVKLLSYTLYEERPTTIKDKQVLFERRLYHERHPSSDKSCR